MRILVTGATGFVGGAAARRLRSRGHQLTVTGRNPEKGRSLQADGLDFVAADLTDRASVYGLVADQDLVVHAAALTSPWGSRHAFWSANVDAVDHILEACARHGVKRLVHISSPSVHATRRGHRTDVPEDAPWERPLNAYILTKREAELRVQASAVPSVVLRPRAVFGPGDNAVLPRIIDALERRRLPLIGGGEHRIDLTYIDNLSQAIERACFEDAAIGGVYHVANGEPRRLVDLIKTLCDALELPFPSRRLPFSVAYGAAAAVELTHKLLPLGEPALTRYGVTAVGCGTTLDITAARRDLGYAPEVDLDEGIARFVTWWKAQRRSAEGGG